MNNNDNEKIVTEVEVNSQNMTQDEKSQPVINGEPGSSSVFAAAPVNCAEVSENTFAGTVGAFIFSLAGGIVWYLLYQVGFIAAISGVVGVICAVKGYEIFAKKLSIHGVIISVIISFIVIVGAWYLCLSKDVYDAFANWYEQGEINYAPTFFESVRNAYTFLKEPEIAKGYLYDLLFGLVCCIVGGFSYIKTALRKARR